MRIVIVKKRTLILMGVVLLALILAVIAAAAAGRGHGQAEGQGQGEKEKTSVAPAMGGNGVGEYELNVLAGRQRELPVYCVERSDKALALTVDAAWDDDKTAFILKTLKQHDVVATFFLCGVWVDAYPAYVKQIAEEGHEIGNHSKTHPHMNQLDAAGVQQEIRALDDDIEALTGKRCTLFRAPFGEYNDTVIRAVREIGYEPIQWNIDTIDWKRERSAETILNAVLPKLSPGSILLCHNNGYEIEDYLPPLIEKAQAEGYTFVTVSELLLSGSTAIDANGMQKPASGEAKTPAPSAAPTKEPSA